MSRLFISHSSSDDHAALALQDWLLQQGWGTDDIYLDISPDGGMAAGQRWVEALDDAQRRCEAVVFLVSKNWLNAKWCREEYTRALSLNKKLYALIIDSSIDLVDLPQGLTSQWQAVWLVQSTDTAKDAPTDRFDTEHPITRETDIVRFTVDGLTRLKNGLKTAAIAPETYALQKDAEGPLGWRSPYRGLEPLEEADAAVFFGRDAEIVKGLDKLREMSRTSPPRFMVILGASGSGKSSFLRAGLLPRLKRDDTNWLALEPIRTGEDGPIDAREGLLRVLLEAHKRLGLPGSRADLRAMLGTSASFIAGLDALRARVAKSALMEDDRRPPTPVLSIDQAEEFFAADAHADTHHVLSLIRAAMDAGSLLCIATIRSDRYSALQSAPELESVHQETFSLPPVSSGELSRIINGPAEVWRKSAGPMAPVFAPEVSQALMDEVHGQEDALPLLAYAMSRLMREHISETSSDKPSIITMTELKATGGVAAAIEREANKALNEIGVENSESSRRKALRQAFIPRLARVDRASHAPERRVAALSDFKEARLQGLINAFVERRLLTLKSDGSEASVEVAHEALLRVWPTLAALLDADKEDLMRLEGALHAAQAWDLSNRAFEYIDHRGGRLVDLQKLQVCSPEWKSALEPAKEYIEACHAAETKIRNRRRMALAGLLSVVFMFSGLFVLQQKRNMEASEAATLFALVDKSKILTSVADEVIEKGKFTQGLLLKLEASNHNPKHSIDDTVASENLLANIFQQNNSSVFLHDGSVAGASFSNDKNLVLSWSFDDTLRLWDSNTGKQIIQPMPHDDNVKGAVFFNDENRILSWGSDLALKIWDSESGKNIGKPMRHKRGSGLFNSIIGAEFIENESKIISWGTDGAIRNWNVGTQELIAPPLMHESSVTGVRISDNESSLISWTSKGNLRLWNFKTGKQISPIISVDGGVNEAFVLENNRHVLTWSFSGKVRKWDIITGVEVESKIGNIDKVERVYHRIFSKFLVLVNGESDEIIIVNKKTWKIEGKAMSHENVAGVILSEDEKYVLSWSGSGNLKMWSTNTFEQIGKTMSHGGGVVRGAVISHNGTMILSWSQDNSVILWDANSGVQIGSSMLHDNLETDGFIREAAFSNDNSRILSWDSIGRINQWDIRLNHELVSRIDFETSVKPPIFSYDNKTIASWKDKNTIELHDSTSNKILMKDITHGFRLYGESKVPIPIRAAVFSPVENNLMTWSSQKRRVWDLETQQVTPFGKDNYKWASELLFSPNGKYILSKENSRLHLWKMKESESNMTFTAKGYSFLDFSFSNDSSKLLTVNENGDIIEYDIKNHGQELFNVNFDGARGANYSSYNDMIVVWSYNKVSIWNATSGAQIGTTVKPGLNLIEQVIFLPDAKSIISWQFRNINVLDVLTSKKIALEMKHEDTVTGVLNNSNGSRIVSWGEDNTVRLWNSLTGNQIGAALRFETEIAHVAFSNEEYNIQIWNSNNSYSVWKRPYLEYKHSRQSDLDPKLLNVAPKLLPVCLTPDQRLRYNLSPDPPCWCQEKPYPSLSDWEEDYLSRHPELDITDENGIWPEGKSKPNPFTHKRSDGWICPAKGMGYSAPWKVYSDIDALAVDELLGPADQAYESLEKLGISISK